MATVIDFMKIHPMTTLLGGCGNGLSSTVHMSDEMSISLGRYLTNGATLDLEKYYQAVNS